MVSDGGFEMLFALSVTLIGVVAMMLLEPFFVHALAAVALRGVERGCGGCCGGAGGGGGGVAARLARVIDLVEEAMLSVTHLSGRAVTMAVLMIWVFVTQQMVLAGLTPSQKGGPVQFRLQLLWSITLTLTSALVTEQLVTWREKVERAQEGAFYCEYR